MSDNLLTIFPNTVYINNDTSLIPLVESWFESMEASDWMRHLKNTIDHNPAFNTTLVSYTREQVNTSYNFIDQSSARPFFDVITDHARTYLSLQGYDKKYQPLIKALWINQMWSGSEHLPHIHEGCFMAGTYYTQVPDGSGPLEFHSTLHDRLHIHRLDVEQDTDYNRIKYSLLPKPGDIILWPSYIKHSVPACQFTGPRRGVAFNLVIME